MSEYTSTILITGGTSGLGYQAALALALSQPSTTLILIASRTDPNSSAAAINKATGHTNCQYLPLDLGTLDTVRAFASTYGTKSYPPISALLLNAGLQFTGPPSYTADNIEKTFAINHVGQALLFFLLMPHLTPSARIVITASGVHDPKQKTGIPDAFYINAGELAKPTSEKTRKNGRQQYSNSKLANVLWMYALSKQMQSQGKTWTVTAMDPGFMPGTGLARDAGAVLGFIFVHLLPVFIPVLRLVVSKNIHTPYESGSALARLAVGEDVDGVSGKYFEGQTEIKSSEESYVVEKQEDLWKWTLDTVSKDSGEREAFEKFQL